MYKDNGELWVIFKCIIKEHATRTCFSVKQYSVEWRQTEHEVLFYTMENSPITIKKGSPFQNPH